MNKHKQKRITRNQAVKSGIKTIEILLQADGVRSACSRFWDAVEARTLIQGVFARFAG